MNIKHRKSNAWDMLCAIYHRDDWIECRFIPHKKEGEKRPYSIWIRRDQYPSEVGQLEKASADGFNVYFGVLGRAGQGERTARGVVCARVLFVDIDRRMSVRAINALASKKGLPRPSIIVNSGHGRHVYWLLKCPIYHMPTYRLLQERLAQEFGADKAVVDAPRVMRLPDFQNLRAERICRILVLRNVRHKSGAFLPLLRPAEKRVPSEAPLTSGCLGTTRSLSVQGAMRLSTALRELGISGVLKDVEMKKLHRGLQRTAPACRKSGGSIGLLLARYLKFALEIVDSDDPKIEAFVNLWCAEYSGRPDVYLRGKVLEETKKAIPIAKHGLDGSVVKMAYETAQAAELPFGLEKYEQDNEAIRTLVKWFHAMSKMNKIIWLTCGVISETLGVNKALANRMRAKLVEDRILEEYEKGKPIGKGTGGGGKATKHKWIWPKPHRKR